jgi:hypothetical protein
VVCGGAPYRAGMQVIQQLMHRAETTSGQGMAAAAELARMQVGGAGLGILRAWACCRGAEGLREPSKDEVSG